MNQQAATKMYKEFKKHALESIKTILIEDEWKYKYELSSGVFFSYACEILLKHIIYIDTNKDVRGHNLHTLYSKLEKEDKLFVVHKFKCYSVALSTLFGSLHNDHVSGRKTYPSKYIFEWQNWLVIQSEKEENSALESNFTNRTNSDTGEKISEVIDQIINNSNAFVSDRYLYQQEDLSGVSNQPQLYCLMMALEELLRKKES